jgi:hypothetical protein
MRWNNPKFRLPNPFVSRHDPLSLVVNQRITTGDSAMLRLIFAGCLAAAPLLAAGQTIYKVQMPDGSVLYSDSVPAGGKVLEEREAKSTPRVNTQPGQPATRGTSTAARPVGPGIRPADKTGKSAVPDVGDAERELAVARRRLELGREPLPGERLGLKGGGSRLTPEYEARIAALERDVEAAEARVKKAYEARNATR